MKINEKSSTRSFNQDCLLSSYHGTVIFIIDEEDYKYMGHTIFLAAYNNYTDI